MVSIIIPYYNRPKKLERCLRSILDQTCTDFEVVIVDDYSPKPLVLDIDDRVQVYRNEKNLGPGFSRNVGLKNSKGNYVAFLDSDDYWHNDFLRNTMKAFIDNKNIVMVCSQVVEVDENGHIFKRRRNDKFEVTQILPYILQYGRPWCTSSCLWDASHAKKNGLWIDSRNWEDYVFDVSIAVANNKIKTLKDTLVYYDASGDYKLSNSKKQNSLLEKYKSLKAIINLNYDIGDVLIKELCYLNLKHICLGLAAQCNDIKNKDLAKKYLYLIASNKMINQFEYFLLLLSNHYITGRYLRHKKASMNKTTNRKRSLTSTS